jgi:predicted enzyme related to lactoylglutathione lyase
VKRHLQAILLTAALAAAVAPGSAGAAPEEPQLPPLSDPSTDAQLSGKFIWADLYTSDVAAARRFYGGLFGWEWRWLTQRPGRSYGMFYQDGIAVAGIAEISERNPGETYARWVHYLSVKDVDEAIESVGAQGGRTMLPRHDIASRGAFAVLADTEDAPFGVLHSSSGDPRDYRAEIGEWLWIGLYARDAPAASNFYSSAFGYEVYESDHDTEVVDIVLASNGFARAGIAQLSAESETAPTWLGYVRVQDVAAIAAKAISLGGTVLYEADDRLAGDLAILTDPFGTPLGVMRWTFQDAEAAQP